MNKYDVIIVGGGLAGLTAALHLSKQYLKVLVIEKHPYPHHKVCGEYVSNEIVPYLEGLGISLTGAKAVAIDTLQLTSLSGKSVSVALPLGGMGFSRFAFDDLLYRQVVLQGADFIFAEVKSIAYTDDIFTVATDNHQVYTSKFTIGAYGKRDSLDKSLNRGFIHHKSAWLGVKAHYRWDALPENVVSLHTFNGGYGGLSKTETQAVNFCYLVTYDSFKKEKDIENFNKNVVAKNPFLSTFIQEAQPLFEEPLSIAQISFHQKKSVEHHIMMCGDAAGLIHPLCGNGMAMAIHSAKIVAELLVLFFGQKKYTRSQLEAMYEQQWQNAFKRRLWMGRKLQALLLHEQLSNRAMDLLAKSPRILSSIIKSTHGTPVI